MVESFLLGLYGQPFLGLLVCGNAAIYGGLQGHHPWRVFYRGQKVSCRAWRLFRMGLLHRFEAERTHLAPGISRERILEYVCTFPLPGPDTLPAFSWLLLRARARLGLTQQALAQRLGVSRRAYEAWESGRRGLLPSQEECLQEELARLLAGPICLSKA